MAYSDNSSQPIKEALKDGTRIRYHHAHLASLLQAIKYEWSHKQQTPLISTDELRTFLMIWFFLFFDMTGKEWMSRDITHGHFWMTSNGMQATQCDLALSTLISGTNWQGTSSILLTGWSGSFSIELCSRNLTPLAGASMEALTNKVDEVGEIWKVFVLFVRWEFLAQKLFGVRIPMNFQVEVFMNQVEPVRTDWSG